MEINPNLLQNFKYIFKKIFIPSNYFGRNQPK
jgi:hypothetical protein